MKVAEIVGDRRNSRKVKGNVLSSCVTPAYMNAIETMTLTDKQEEKVQVYETNLVRRIVGVKRADKRRTGELRVEIGVKEKFKKKLARARLTLTDHAE